MGETAVQAAALGLLLILPLLMHTAGIRLMLLLVFEEEML